MQSTFDVSCQGTKVSGKVLGQRSTLWSLALIAFLVVFVRWAVFLVDTTQADIADDVDCYLEIARNVVGGHGYSLSDCHPFATPQPTAMRGPTVVYFFATVLSLFGDHPWSIVIAQWMVDVGTAIILFFITMEIFQDRRVAFVACLLFAFYEPGLIFTFRGYSEPLFTLTLAGFTLSLLYLLREPSIGRYLLCGLLLGLAVLARPIMEFYPLVLLPLLLWALRPRWRHAFSGWVLACLAFTVVLLPWAIRNYVVFKAIIPVTSNRGAPFWDGNHNLAQPDYLYYRGTEEANLELRKILEARFGPAPKELDMSNYDTKIKIKRLDPSGAYAIAKGFSELQMDHFASEEAMKVVRAYPGRYVMVSIVRFFRLWFQHRFVDYVLFGGRLPRAWLVAAINAVLLGLAAAAFMWLRGSWFRPGVVSVVVLVAYNSAIYAATHALGRYNVPTIPYVMVFAAFTIVQLFSKWSKADGVLT